jgi:hypothetical protein
MRPFILLLLLSLAAVLAAQSPTANVMDKAKGAAQAQGEQQSQQQLTSESVEALVKDELQSADAYRYDSRGRRDPFRSLLERNVAQERPECQKGTVGCLLWDDITLQGIWKVKGVFISQILAKNGDVYWVKEGDAMYDGQVMKIGMNCVDYKQKVNDPTKINPFRDVDKCLIPEETK